MTTIARDTVAIRRLHCPRCRKPPESLIEHIGVTSTFDVTADGRQRTLEGYHATGHATHVTARCACGHRWRLPGVVQITDLDHGGGRLQG